MLFQHCNVRGTIASSIVLYLASDFRHTGLTKMPVSAGEVGSTGWSGAMPAPTIASRTPLTTCRRQLSFSSMRSTLQLASWSSRCGKTLQGSTDLHLDFAVQGVAWNLWVSCCSPSTASGSLCSIILADVIERHH